MKTNYRHCEERRSRDEAIQLKTSTCIKQKKFLSNCFAALAMTFFLTIFTTPVAACPSWVAQWRNHSGYLPNASRTSAPYLIEWFTGANFRAQTAHGVAWCGTSSTVPPTIHNTIGTSCWCRLTSVSEIWSNPFSSVRGSGTETCTGTMPGTACSGPWVFLVTWPGTLCAQSCAANCASCVLRGSDASCTRAAIFAPS